MVGCSLVENQCKDAYRGAVEVKEIYLHSPKFTANVCMAKDCIRNVNQRIRIYLAELHALRNCACIKPCAKPRVVDLNSSIERQSKLRERQAGFQNLGSFVPAIKRPLLQNPLSNPQHIN